MLDLAPPRPSPEDLDALARELSDALEPARVGRGADVRRQHGTDESFHPPAPPDIVVWPTSVDEAAAVVRACARHRSPLVPFGAGTSLEGHVAARHGGVCVDMSRMDAVLRLSVEDLDVTVQAGVTRRQLDERLRPEGVFFPVDPGADATIGGMVATGASGTTTVRYGAMRENVINLRVVTADGEVVRTRSRARKSSAGYDLTRLLIGSEGTLALICEATLRLQPTPEAMVAAVCALPSMRAAVDCVTQILQFGIRVARIELADELQIRAINRFEGTTYAEAPTLFLEFHGSPAEAAAQARDAEEVAAAQGAVGFAWAAEEAERRRLWHARHRAYEASRALVPGRKGLTTDACVPLSELADCIVETQADIAEQGLVATIVGHVGDGNFHTCVLVDPDDPRDLARAEAFHDRMIRRALACGGTCSGEHGVGYGKSRFLEEEHGPRALALMRAVKHAFDPDGILNPGKVADLSALA